MRVLIVEDDFTARKLLQAYLREYFECDVAVNGKEAVQAFRDAIAKDKSYDLITMDVSMPEMNGQQALKEIRDIETEYNVDFGDGTKVIMTTAFNDKDNVMLAFRLGCESYLVKPVSKTKLFNEIDKLGLLQLSE
ncbi:MAG: response regulator [Phycisphaerae bacterium]|nr:response regulator [Phycisphaerae bacterium]